MTARPHDALFKWAFEAPTDAAALLRELLPPAVRDAISWDTLEGASGSFVDLALADRHTDLLFAVRLRTMTSPLAYLLLEHLCGAPHKCSYAEPPTMRSRAFRGASSSRARSRLRRRRRRADFA
jgi:hypothetical protein